MPTTLDHPPDVDEETETCDTCHASFDECDCETCPSCEERVWPRAIRDCCGYCHYCCDCQQCPSCGSRLRWGEICGSCDYCSECCTCNDDSSDRLIHDYSYTPDTLTFISVRGGELHKQYSSTRAPDGATYLGLEIECEAVHGEASDIADVWTNGSPFGYAKHDGSLSDGVECVTHPITYEALRLGDLGSTLGRMARAGARAWGTGSCGLHIHVSRKAFGTRSHLWRFVRALDSLQGDLIKLSGRHSQEWASWNTDKPAAHAIRRYGEQQAWRYCERAPATKIAAGKASNGTRYRAINMENSQTVECRFWRGTLHPVGVLGAAALTDALVQWTAVMPFRQIRDGLTFQQFLTWSADNLPGQQYVDIQALVNKRSTGTRASRGDIECAS